MEEAVCPICDKEVTAKVLLDLPQKATETAHYCYQCKVIVLEFDSWYTEDDILEYYPEN